MDQIKVSLGESQQQTQLQQQQQKLKKKSKNKKKSSRTEATTVSTVGTAAAMTLEVGKGVADISSSCGDQESTKLAVNGLTEQLKQQLQLGGSREASSHDNASKVNGLVTENHVNTNACPNKTNATDSLKNGSENVQSPLPAINGHHVEDLSKSTDSNGEVQAPIKKTKRKPNNKKNPPITNADNMAATKENGHCPSKANSAKATNVDKEKEHLHNGFSRENKKEDSNEKQLNTTLDKPTTATVKNDKTAMTPASLPEKEQNIKQKSSDKEESTEKSLQDDQAPIENRLDLSNVHIEYKEYESELQMHDIMRLIQAELSEPYSIYTYRYFIYNWPKLCFLAAHGNEYVGAIVCKLDMNLNMRRGYIAMLAVRKEYRKLKIGTTLVQKAIEAMLADKADEVVLETEMSNLPALRLYENLGFVRDKRLFRYYLNGVDALRLKLWFR